jgi:MoxR-like ATPase
LPEERDLLVASSAPARNFQEFAHRFGAIKANIERVIEGKPDVIHLAVVALVAEGHVLIEDVPGVGKTMLAKALARSIDCTWRRIQFTPDLLPSDVTGVSIFNTTTGDFEFKPGAIFSNVVLGDEINRASPKTQAALLECMEERQVTTDGITYHLDPPFMVIATQNPIEHEGTYPLPEAQLDRFAMRLRVGYPSRETSLAILESHGVRSTIDDLQPVADAEEVRTLVEWARDVHVAPSLKGYMTDLAESTRHHSDISLGASPRALLFLQRCARALAGSLGREYVIPDDLKALLHPVWEHRLLLTPEAQMRGLTQTEALRDAVARVPVPGSRAG